MSRSTKHVTIRGADWGRWGGSPCCIACTTTIINIETPSVSICQYSTVQPAIGNKKQRRNTNDPPFESEKSFQHGERMCYPSRRLPRISSSRSSNHADDDNDNTTPVVHVQIVNPIWRASYLAGHSFKCFPKAKNL